MNLPGLDDIKTDPYDQDTAAAAFSKAHSVRQRARELCVQFNASQKVKLSTSGVRHKQRTWAVGQRVYVYRRFSGTGQGHLTRSRWIGPGVVVLQAGHTVWVSTRARLLKCNSDQLRPASSHETLGAELARAGELAEVIQQTRAGKTGAVDVAREGSPPSDAWDDQGPSVSEAPIVVSPDAELPSIPEPTNPPSGRTGGGHLLRTLSTPMEELPPIPEDAQSSTRTLEEPQQEPSRQVSISEPLLDDTVIEAEIKRQRTDSLASRTPSLDAQSDTSQGRVRSQVSQMEMDRLQREAVRELRRLDRLERQQAALDRRGVASSSRDTHFSESPSISLFSSSPGLFRIDKQNDSFVAKPEKSKNGEFNLKTASPEELEGFRLSDAEEWRSILEDFKAVTVLSPQDSQNVRRDQPQRIVTSRMVRRKKPTPGVGGWKFKSRWCIHGHVDPDNGSFETYSPMPSTEAIALFFQLSLNCDLKVAFADVKCAFCQSDKLNRPAGGIFVEPCSGLNLPHGSLIKLIAPVYGLEDAPLRWHLTVVSFFESLGFKRSLLEPCWMVKRENGKVLAQILIEVDDINVAADQSYLPVLRTAMDNKFTFGKWNYDSSDFAGRSVSFLPDKVLMHQQKYILEKVFPVRLSKGRKTDKQSSLETSEFEEFRSMLYRVNWLAHQTRPECAGVVSILSSRLHHATVHDVNCLNKLISHLRSTASQPLILHKFDSSQMVLIAASDAGGIDSIPPITEPPGQPVSDNVQGAWIIMASDRLPSASGKIRVSVLSWRSSKLKRRVSSTLASETLAFGQALGELEWIQLMIRDVLFGDVCKDDWSRSLSPFLSILRSDCELKSLMQQCTITDAKSLFDSLTKHNQSSRQDRRTAVELSIIHEEIVKTKSIIRWTPHPKMVADVLTKDDIGRSNGAFEEVLKCGKLALWDEDTELTLRKEVPGAKNRSKAASMRSRMLSESSSLFTALEQSQINKKLGELFSELTI